MSGLLIGLCHNGSYSSLVLQFRRQQSKLDSRAREASEKRWGNWLADLAELGQHCRYQFNPATLLKAPYF